MRNFTITICFLFCSFFVHAQFIDINIKVNGGNTPSEVTWNLYNDANNLLLISDGGQIQQANFTYDWDLTASCNDCYRFVIEGLDAEASYSIRVDNDWYVYQGKGANDPIVHYIGTCTQGSTCQNPEVLLMNSEFQYRSTSKENHWYQIQSDSPTFLTINTCAFDMQGLPKDTKLWIYEDCPGIIEPGPEGALFYNDESFNCGASASLNNMVLQANTNYILRVGNLTGDTSEKLGINFFKIPENPGCIDPASCNFNPFANVDDGSCDVDDTCGPDLWVNDTILLNSVHQDQIMVEDSCLFYEECVNGFGLRDIVRFSTAIHNIGDADFIVGDPEVNSNGFSNDNCHGHWHQLGYAQYFLYAGAGEPEPLGLKNGFCVLDIACTSEEAIPKYGCSYMGITAGCYDIYDSSIACQWLDVTDVVDGDYTLVVRVNWNGLPDMRGKHELSYDNNAAQVCINLDRSSGSLVVTVLADCATYVDCFGIENGTAVVDCLGECGGTALLGDVFEDAHLDSLDVQFYLHSLAWDNDFLTGCTDLNQDGTNNLCDAALLLECVESNDPSDPNHTHGQCNYSSMGLPISSDTVWIKIENIQSTTFDIAYWSPHHSLKGLNVEITGTDITTLSFTDPNTYPFRSNSLKEIFLLASEDGMPINDDFNKLLTVHANAGNEVCIKEAAKAINGFNEEMVVMVINSCESIVSSVHENRNADRLLIYPTITNDFIYLQNQTNSSIDRIQIFDLKGQLLWRQDDFENNRIPVDFLGNNLYILNVVFQSGDHMSKRFIVAD